MSRTISATIDKGGRVVVPKAVRERLGLLPGTEVQLTEGDGVLEVAPAPTPMRLVEREGRVVAEATVDLPALTADVVRDTLEQQRR
jgi:AbrB family looped-hinge helix DNA binding protein